MHTSTNFASALATRGTEEQKARRRLPSCKRQPATPQKKIWFPQCRLGRMGGEAQPQLPSRVAEKDLQFNPGLRAWCKQQPLAGRPSSIYSAHWVCVLKSETQKRVAGREKKKKNKQKNKNHQQQCFVSCTQFVCFFLLFSGKKIL